MKSLLKPENLLSLSNQKSLELLDGQVIARNQSVESRWIGGNTPISIARHAPDGRLGWTSPAENGGQGFADSLNTVRRPDITFVRRGRMSCEMITGGWLRIMLDLVVEVFLPNDLAEVVEEKVEMIHKPRVVLHWVVSPTARNDRAIHASSSTTMLREGDELSGEDVIPGFVCSVASIFPSKVLGSPVHSASGI